MAKTREVKTLGDLMRLLKWINIHPAWLIVPIVLSLAAATFEGASVALLIPLLNGFLQKDFSFIKEAPILGDVTVYLPESVTGSDQMLFVFLISIFVLAVILKNVLKYLSIVSLSFITCRAVHHLRKVMFGRYMSFGKLFFDRSNLGQHQTALTEFVGAALMPVNTIDKQINAFFSIIAYLVVMSMISWQISFFALPLFVLLYFSIHTLVTRLQRISRATALRGMELGQKSVEILGSIPLVKAYRMEKKERKKYSCISDRKARLEFKSACLRHTISPLHELITLFVGLGILGVMLFLLVRGEAQAAPPLIVYFYLILNSANKFGILTQFRATIAKALGPLEEIKKVFDDADKHFVKGGKKEFKVLEDKIELKSLSFTYPGKIQALKNVSASFKYGKATAVVGHTGSGKTTLINLLMRYYSAPEESIFIDGTDIREFSLDSLLGHIAVVSQETFLLNDTLGNNIAYGLEDITDNQLGEVVSRARLSELVDQYPEGLNTLIGDRGVMLSGGEKQRVAIARALLKGADILILDEATSSLDSRTERLVQEAIDEVIEGRTAIVIAHRLSTIQHSDKILVLKNGELVEEGSLDSLLTKKGEFYEMWEEQKFD